jgi:hypothetical protein
MPSPILITEAGYDRKAPREDAIQAAIAAVELRAVQSVHDAQKRRARMFMRQLNLLEEIYPTLSLANSRRMNAIADHLSEHRPEVRGFNIKAIRMIARWIRRFEEFNLIEYSAAEARRDAMMETAS